MSPGQGAADIENQVSRVNRRFDTICEQVQRKAERIDLSKQRNVEVSIWLLNTIILENLFWKVWIFINYKLFFS